MILYASYVCLLHSHFVENHPIDLAMMNPSFLRWFCHSGGGATRAAPQVGGGADPEGGVPRCVGEGHDL
jgi:hypothetical protein